MVRLTLFLFTIIFSNLSYSDDNNQLQINKPPVSIEPFTLITENGIEENFFNTNEKVILLNFWATWCPPCIKEIPDLQKLKKEFGSGLEVFFISVDSNFEKVVPKFLKKNIEEFLIKTDSKKAKKILDNFDIELKNFKQVCPIEMLDKLENPISIKPQVKKAG